MTDDDKRALYGLLKNVHDFYRADLTPFAAQVWWNALQPYSLEQVQKAFTAHASDPKVGSFCPKPADLVRVLQGTHEDRALLAWGRVFDAIRRVGQYQSVAFGEPAVHAAIIDMGGWPKICASTEDELPFLQRRFCELHQAYTRRGGIDAPEYLPGLSAIANGGAGYAVKGPVPVGIALEQMQQRAELAAPEKRIGVAA